MAFTVWLETNNNKLTIRKREMQRGKVIPRNGRGCNESLHTGGSDLIREVRMYASVSHKKAEASQAHY